MQPILSVSGVSKMYKSGVRALEAVDLDIRRGEIFALLGPNGAGKTTLISIICGIVSPSGGTIKVAGFDAIRQPREARKRIGLVPQEAGIDMFERLITVVRFSRGLFGRPRDDALIERILTDLSLWDKRDAKLNELSGGMRRRVLIAKALAHEPELLFLDEPTAGVDVSLRRDMWKLVHRLREQGTTIILTTHYIEEAEEMADRVGVIDKGKLLLVDEKAALMQKLGKRRMLVSLSEPMAAIPPELAEWRLELADEGHQLRYSFDARAESAGIPSLLRRLSDLGIGFTDLDTSKSSLEDIFVDLVHPGEAAA
jgi:ABC-2 type transport system ATP-binding protein